VDYKLGQLRCAALGGQLKRKAAAAPPPPSCPAVMGGVASRVRRAFTNLMGLWAS